MIVDSQPRTTLLLPLLLPLLLLLAVTGPTRAAENLRIGSLFALTGPNHNGSFPGPNRAAGAIIALRHIQQRNGTVLPVLASLSAGLNVTMAVSDTESSGSKALLRTLDHLQVFGAHAVVGPQSSSKCTVTGFVTAAFTSAQISYSCTAAALSNTANFPTFFRVVPPDNLQGQALASICAAFGWQSVAMLFSNGDYGSGLAGSFRTHAVKLGIEILVSASFDELTSSPSDEKLVSAIRTVASTTARIIVLFASDNDVVVAMRAGEQLGLSRDQYQWVGADGVAQVNTLKLVGEYAVGTIATEVFSGVGSAEYLRFAEVWKQQRTADFPDIVSRVTADAKFTDSVFTSSTINSKTPLAYDSVVAIAIAADRALARNSSANITRSLIYNEMRRTDFNFTGISGQVSFDASGDREAFYVLNNFQLDKTTGNFSNPTTAKWNAASGLVLDSSTPIVWQHGGTEVPSHTKPRLLRSLSKDVRIVFLAINSILMVVTVLIGILVFKLRMHRALMASGPMFGYIMIGGIIVGYAGLMVLYVPKSHDGVCESSLLLVSLAFSTVYATLIGKTWRIKLLFTNKHRILSHRARKWLRNEPLLLFIFAFAAWDLLIFTLWQIIDETSVVRSVDPRNSSMDVLECSSAHWDLWMGLLAGPKIVALFYGATLAWKVRNVPSKFNESKALSVAIYNICFMAIFVVPVLQLVKLQILLVHVIVHLAIWFIFCSTIALVFVPKFWHIMHHPSDVAVPGAAVEASRVSRLGSNLRPGDVKRLSYREPSRTRANTLEPSRVSATVSKRRRYSSRGLRASYSAHNHSSSARGGGPKMMHKEESSENEHGGSRAMSSEHRRYQSDSGLGGSHLRADQPMYVRAKSAPDAATLPRADEHKDNDNDAKAGAGSDTADALYNPGPQAGAKAKRSPHSEPIAPRSHVSSPGHSTSLPPIRLPALLDGARDASRSGDADKNNGEQEKQKQSLKREDSMSGGGLVVGTSTANPAILSRLVRGSSSSVSSTAQQRVQQHDAAARLPGRTPADSQGDVDSDADENLARLQEQERQHAAEARRRRVVAEARKEDSKDNSQTATSTHSPQNSPHHEQQQQQQQRRSSIQSALQLPDLSPRDGGPVVQLRIETPQTALREAHKLQEKKDKLDAAAKDDQ